MPPKAAGRTLGGIGSPARARKFFLTLKAYGQLRGNFEIWQFFFHFMHVQIIFL